MKPNEPSFIKPLPAQSLPPRRREPLIDLRRPPVIIALAAALGGLGLGAWGMYRSQPAVITRLPPAPLPDPNETAAPRATAEKPAAARVTATAMSTPAAAAAAAPTSSADRKAGAVNSPSATTPAPAQARESRPGRAAAPASAQNAELPHIDEMVNVDASIYSSRDKDVTPPVAISQQELGAVPPGLRREDKVMIEVVLDEEGNVESVRTLDAPQSLGDAAMVTMSLHAVKSWRFQPALKDGRPVKYRQQIPVTLR